MRSRACMHALLMLIVVVFSAPAFAKKAPDWISGKSKDYPEQNYFIGVGTASMDKGAMNQQMQLASDRARAEVAKALRSHVETSTTEESTARKESKKDKVSTSVKRSEVIVVRAGEVLEGVEIRERYTDKKAKQVYALAVLDRVEAAKMVEDKIERLQKDVLVNMESGKASMDKPFVAIRNYSKALSSAMEIEPLDELYSILKPHAAREQLHYVPEIEQILAGLKKNLCFTVAVEGPAASVSSDLIAGLTANDLSVRKQCPAESAAYELKGTTDLTYKGQIDMGENLLMEIYQADLSLLIEKNGGEEQAGSLSWSMSANEKTQEMASKSAVRALGQLVKRKIADDLFGAK